MIIVSGLVEKVATQKDKLQSMGCVYPETDLYKWLLQFTWECNIFTCSLKGVKFFLAWENGEGNYSGTAILFCMNLGDDRHISMHPDPAFWKRDLV